MSQRSTKAKSRSKFHLFSSAKPSSESSLGVEVRVDDTTTKTSTGSASTLKGIRSLFRSVSPMPTKAAASTSTSPSPTRDSAQPQSKKGVTSANFAHKNLGHVGWNFTKTLITTIGDFAEPNPIKLAFGVAKMIINISETVKENMDTVERRIHSIAAQLTAVEQVVEGWTGNGVAEKRAIERFEQALGQEFAKLKQLSEEWLVTKVADHEEEKGQIAVIFERVQEARLQLGVETNLRILKMAHAIDRNVRDTLLERLRPSSMADHTYELEGSQKEKLRRVVCAHGTRTALLDEIITWGKDGPELVYWLSGPAGSGKSTVAYTLARRFELAGSEDPVVLGANFFCSRHYEETRFATRIIRTIAYQLALRFKPFADALTEVGEFGSATKGIQSQLQDLLITPWRQVIDSRSTTNPGAEPPHHLIIIDALDELDSTGGAEFLRHVLPALAKNTLHGLKFLVTSRPDPELGQQLTSFEAGKAFRLQDIAPEDARSDVEIYLLESVPQLVGTQQFKQLVALTDGLFIFASTIVYHLLPRRQAEQLKALDRLFALNRSSQPDPQASSSRQATRLLDQLYDQLLKEALKDFEDTPEYLDRLHILHTFLCANEPVSPGTTAGLVFEDEYPNPTISSTPIADDVVSTLHAVLYIHNGKVFSYHKSFADFIFDQGRSGEFACSAPTQHRSLAQSCLRILNTGLRFNIAHIPSSTFMDSKDPTLHDRVERNIPPILRYACHQWTYHLSSFPSPPPPSPDQDPLCDALHAFLALPALFWIEAMNLLGSGDLCDPLFQRAYDIATLLGLPWAPRFLEAANFAAYFVGSLASLSTPHLYISALATWPRQSSPIAEWKSRFPTIPRFTNPSNKAMSLSTFKLGSIVHSVQIIDHDHGLMILCGTDDGVARVLDASTGSVRLILKGHDAAVRSVAYSKSYQQIATASNDGTVRLWDLTTGHPLSTLVGHREGVRAIAFSPDGTRLVSGSVDTTAIIWNPLTGGKEHSLIGHTRAIECVAYSPDARWIATGAFLGPVRVWDPESGNLVRLLSSTSHTTSVNCMSATADGQWIVAGSGDGTVTVWEPSTGNIRFQTRPCPELTLMYSLAIIPSTQKLALATAAGPILVWDMDTIDREGVTQLDGHARGVHTLAVSSSGRRFASGSIDGTIRVWDVSVVDHKMDNESHNRRVTDIVFSSDGSRIASASADGTIHLRDSGTGELLRTFQRARGGGFWSASISKDGTRILAGGRDGVVCIWDTDTRDKVGELQAHSSSVYALAISDDGTVVVSASADMTVKVWDPQGLKTLATFQGNKIGPQFRTACFSAWNNGVLVVSVNETGGLGVSNSTAASPRSGVTPLVLDHNVYTTAVSRNGKWVAGAFWGDSWVVWNGKTGEQVRQVTGSRGASYRMDISDNGALLVTGSADGVVRVWDIAAGTVLCAMEGHAAKVKAVRLNHNADRVVSAGEDGTIRIWDLARMGGSACYTREASEGLGTGWLLPPHGDGYLMFVPRDARLSHEANVLTVPPSAVSSVDFTNATTGDQWVNCYVPFRRVT